MADIIRINMEAREITRENAGKYAGYGSRGFIARFMNDEVDPACEPLGINNKLIMVTGLLGGTMTSCSGRLSVGGKSPLTNGIKEASSGGTAANDMARLGIRALVFERLPAPGDNNSYVLLVSEDGISLETMNELRLKGAHDTIRILREKYGQRAGVICNGPAGEYMMRAAGVVCASPDNSLRLAARGGLGALMGSKHVKAVVIIPSKTNKLEYFDKAAYDTATKEYHQMLIDAYPTIQKSNQLYGTTSIVKVVDSMGSLPTRNFKLGSFDKVDEISGEKLVELIQERGGAGKTGIACMNGCMIRCSSIFPDKKGNKICSTVQYENIALLGSNLCIDNLDDIALLNDKVNDLGLDAIEIGAALGVAAEAGFVEFGDGPGFLKLLDDVLDGTPFGRIIGNGTKIAGDVLGINDLPISKNQAFPGYDPRALKGNGVTYATNPMGGDHTLGNCFGSRGQVPPLATEEQGKLSYDTQVQMAGLENLGFCIFARSYLFKRPELFTQMVYGITGEQMTVEEFWNQAKETAALERTFNVNSGISPAMDRLPEYMYREPLAPTGHVFDLSDEEMLRGVV